MSVLSYLCASVCACVYVPVGGVCRCVQVCAGVCTSIDVLLCISIGVLCASIDGVYLYRRYGVSYRVWVASLWRYRVVTVLPYGRDRVLCRRSCRVAVDVPVGVSVRGVGYPIDVPIDVLVDVPRGVLIRGIG